MQNQLATSISTGSSRAHSVIMNSFSNHEDSLFDLTAQIQLACCEQAVLTPQSVRKALDEALVGMTATELAHQILTLPRKSETYTRHILHADPKGRFTIVALVWEKGQASPVHAHFTWCAYKVLNGVLSESHFEWDRSAQQAKLTGEVERPSGQSVCGHAGLELIHQLGNRQEQPAVSIHVYGMDSDRIGTHVNRLLVCDHHA